MRKRSKTSDVHLLRGKTDSAPLFDFLPFLGNLFPVLGNLVFLGWQPSHLFSRASFLGEVFLFLGTQVFQVLLGASITVLAALKRSQICSQTPSATGPFRDIVVEVLKPGEGRNSILFLIEFLLQPRRVGSWALIFFLKSYSRASLFNSSMS